MEALLLLPDMPGYERFLKKWCPLMYADIQKKYIFAELWAHRSVWQCPVSWTLINKYN